MQENANIMESSIEDLLEIIRQQILHFENATQLTSGLAVCVRIDHSVIELDTYLHKIKRSGTASTPDRNSIRLICKETYKIIPEEVSKELQEQVSEVKITYN